MERPKAIVVDTNVLIHDPESIYTLMNDINVLLLHTIVLQELDNLKKQRDIGRDCREAIRIIEQLQKEQHPRLKIVQKSEWNSGLGHLNASVPDHQIIALAYNLKDSNVYKETKLISKDSTVRILARDLGIIAEDYFSEEIKVDNTKLKEVKVPANLICDCKMDHVFEMENMDEYQENEGVLCWSNWNGQLQPQSNADWGQHFTAVKKKGLFRIINSDIHMMSITPYSINGDGPNWEQYVAMKQLLDPSIKLCFLIGGAGSGKTILAIAAALEQRRMYRNILVTRPMVHLEDEDNMGFLPGDINDKMSPWLRPIWRSLSFIGGISKYNQDTIQSVRDKNKFEVEPLDYIRGMTYVKDILIVDESQNLTPHQIKTIITRAGEHSKIIFTGDLGQIDKLRKIDSNSSGLAYASAKMSNQPMVSTVHFKKTVRSELANLADKLL